MILGIDTGTDVCSVALFDESGIICSRESKRDFSHASILSVFIDECVKEAGVSLKQLDAIAIASGPGSYTGLRVGASTAKGMCFALDRPLISIDSLTTLAYSTIDMNLAAGDIVMPMIDARRKEVYISSFDHALNIISPIEKLELDQAFFNQVESKKCVLIGNGYMKFEEYLTDNFVKSYTDTKASFLRIPAFKAYNSNNFQEIISFSPFYLNNPNITVSNKTLLG
jgi:tRNA threonylcarbamoyladenosine biosynthesis protein TsaB